MRNKLMKDTILVTLNQYQKHLVVDLLKENGVEVECDNTLASNFLKIRVRIKTDSEGKEIIPYEKIYTVIMKDMEDIHLTISLEVFADLSELVNKPTRYLDPLYDALVPKVFDVSRSETEIFLKKSGEVILQLPYDWMIDRDAI